MKKLLLIAFALLFGSVAYADILVTWEVVNPEHMTEQNFYWREDPGAEYDQDLINGVDFIKVNLPLDAREYTITGLTVGVSYCSYVEAISSNSVDETNVKCLIEKAGKAVIRLPQVRIINE